MFRNQYDTDVTTFSPVGRLHQVEYAMEAVKQGACSVGLRSKNFSLIASIKRSNSELASYQQKVFTIDNHMGIAISGLVADARVLAQYMRQECLNHRYVYGTAHPTERLVVKLSDKSQYYTQRGDKRPYGVGLLVASYDEQTGAHLYQTEPSGVYFEYKAQAIGARSQSAKTYLEKVYENFENSDDVALDTLINHILTALKGASTKKLTSRNVAVGIVGKGIDFHILEGESIKKYVNAVTNEDDEDEVEEKKDNYGNVIAEEEEKKKREDEAEEMTARAVQDEVRSEEQSSANDMQE